tara:strand:- start:303 stop:1022 length:720 start_codon:yes stop_codon:yes gene_type:complete
MPNNKFLNDLKFLAESGVYEFVNDATKNYYTREKQRIPNANKGSDLSDLSKIKTLEELKNSIASFDKCDLKNISNTTVFSDGNPDSNIMLIGEAPGKDEDIQGKPFVGKAGKLLDKMLAAIDLNRTNVYITNILPWRPPGNRQPTLKEIILCLPFVQRHIEIINPKLLILLGGTASKALLMSDSGIMRLQGKWHSYSSYGLANPILTRAIFHPAFLLRSPSYKKLAWEDLLTIQKEIKK